MRKHLLVSALALALLVPPVPTPTKAGTFEIEITPPFILFADVDAGGMAVAIACIDPDGPLRTWVVIRRVTGTVIEGYAGVDATLKDKTGKRKAKFSDKAKTAASADIQRLDLDASGPTNLGTVEDVKATMKGKVAYVVDPASEGDLEGTSGKLKVKDQTNGETLTIEANVATKAVTLMASCLVTVDEAGRPLGAHVSGLTAGGKRLDIRLGR